MQVQTARAVELFPRSLASSFGNLYNAAKDTYAQDVPHRAFALVTH